MKLILFLLAVVSTETTNGTCPDKDELCLSCTGNICASCVYSYLSVGYCAKPSKKVDNCGAYVSDGVCYACEPGYTLASVTSCKKIEINNCLSVDTTGKCITCSNGKKPSADGKSCSETACTDTNCTECTVVATIETCSRCKSGYAYDLTTFKCATEKVANCGI